MKSQEAFIQELGLTPKRDQGTCVSVNKWIFQKALRFVDQRTRRKYERSRTRLLFGDDLPTESGPEFFDTDISLVLEEEQHVAAGRRTEEQRVAAGRHSNRKATFVLTSPMLETPNVGPPPPFNGVYYCKHWTVESAISFIHQNAKSGKRRY